MLNISVIQKLNDDECVKTTATVDHYTFTVESGRYNMYDIVNTLT